MRVMSWIGRYVATFALLSGLVACGVVAPALPGNTLDATLARMGEPRAQYALQPGQRLFYAVRPGELESFDFDAGGQLMERRTALSQARFAALAQRGGDAAAVQLEFGPPSKKKLLDDDGGLLWTYSWREYDVWRIARVSFDKAGLLQRVEQSEDALADERYR